MTTYFPQLMLLLLYVFLNHAEPIVNNGDPSCYITNAPQCNGLGNYNCGVCECYGQYGGEHCECFPSDGPRDCIAPATEQECSGKGTCICGQCECDIREAPNEVVSGKWCECENFSCPRFNGEICGGHGRCECGQCSCGEPWIGNACECYNSTLQCYAPFDSNVGICSGHGDCVCGTCECHKSEDLGFFGRYCERTITNTCNVLNECVQCKREKDDDTCSEKCENILLLEVEYLEANEDEDEYLCDGYYENGCKYLIQYVAIPYQKLIHAKLPRGSVTC